jgi:hypothetical protein
MRATHYRGSIDGDIKKYLKKMHENGAVCPSFKGYEPFKQLLDLGVMLPEVASIRLVHGQGSDEHYILVDENSLEGVELKAHSGKPGLHNAEILLTTTQAPFCFWEAGNLDPRAFRG